MSEPNYLSEKFSVTLRMQSDWHVGSGTGRPGDIDALVRRDKNDLPYVPAKTLTGIWRDACETVARGLDNGEGNGVWQQWVTYLFGDQPAAACVKDSESARGREMVQVSRLVDPLTGMADVGRRARY